MHNFNECRPLPVDDLHPALLPEGLFLRPKAFSSCADPILIGVLRGEGIGPEVTGCALEVLDALRSETGRRFQVEFGGEIGRDSEKVCGASLSEEVIGFCSSVFARGGAILSGAGGGRYVYDLRQEFDLFCKLSPIQVWPELAGAQHMRVDPARAVDILVVREGASGLYQGEWGMQSLPDGSRLATQSFSYAESDVRRIVQAAARMAARRRGALAVVYKESGAPTISELWRDCGRQAAAEAGVKCSFLDVDYAAYRMLQHPLELDVVVAPNLCGDVLSDLGGVLLGSRALTYGGNFSTDGSAFYQTNHGAAYDLAGLDRANPVGQILSLSLMLRESFGLMQEAGWIEAGVREVWRQGWRTDGLPERGCRLAGTRQTGHLVACAVRALQEKALCCEAVASPG